ncbi:hypothetical protein M9H77_25979 [Catharanthus roseus]|uniref:Uncharacterized protein n=1 Tax=Catharanthus roseus TaxID=4058 RepID=A0ACC0A9C6_CATRO|nr:hypothetical protein M9H77_25979 [Catharanthus roseus]
MKWYNNESTRETSLQIVSAPPHPPAPDITKVDEIRTLRCPSCGHTIQLQHQTAILEDLPGLPAGVKFDPSDQEILEHLEAKALSDTRKLHPLIDEFIPTLDGENGICYTHPEKLPGVSKDGQIRHFFHKPSKAYTTGTRKRRKVHTDSEIGGETRWHKTGKTRPVFVGGILKGYKKILVLYTNYGRQRKPEKTNWVMHQYHLGSDEEEKDGELVVSKVFYQTQPRQCNTSTTTTTNVLKQVDNQKILSRQDGGINVNNMVTKSINPPNFMEYYGGSHDHDDEYLSYNVGISQSRGETPPQPHQLIPNMVHVHATDDGSSFIQLPSTASKAQ